MSQEERNSRKVYRGQVVSDKMDKTIVVSIETQKQHPKYGKRLNATKHIKVHDENNEAKPGDIVSVMGTRAYSKDKHFRLLEILEVAPVL